MKSINPQYKTKDVLSAIDNLIFNEDVASYDQLSPSDAEHIAKILFSTEPKTDILNFISEPGKEDLFQTAIMARDGALLKTINDLLVSYYKETIEALIDERHDRYLQWRDYL